MVKRYLPLVVIVVFLSVSYAVVQSGWVKMPDVLYAGGLTTLIGCIGALIVGIFINILSDKHRKSVEKTEEGVKYRTDYKETINVKLSEIIESWDRALAQDPLNEIKIQKEFSNYASQLTHIIARAPDDFSEDVIEEIRKMTIKLEELPRLFAIYYDYEYGNLEHVYRECHKIKEKAEDIREKK